MENHVAGEERFIEIVTLSCSVWGMKSNKSSIYLESRISEDKSNIISSLVPDPETQPYQTSLCHCRPCISVNKGFFRGTYWKYFVMPGVSCPLFAQPSAIHPAVCHLPRCLSAAQLSAVHPTVRRPLSAVHCPPSTVHCPPSAVCCSPSAILNVSQFV